MARIHAVLGIIEPGGVGGVTHLPSAVPAAVETLESNDTTQSTTITAPLGDGRWYWSVTARGGDVWIAFGADPEAEAGAGWLVLDGETREFSASHGQKLAVIDA